MNVWLLSTKVQTLHLAFTEEQEDIQRRAVLEALQESTQFFLKSGRILFSCTFKSQLQILARHKARGLFRLAVDFASLSDYRTIKWDLVT